MFKKHIVLITDVSYWKRAQGSQARIFNLVLWLSTQATRLDVIYCGTEDCPDLASGFPPSFRCHVLSVPKAVNRRRFAGLRRLKRWLRRFQPKSEITRSAPPLASFHHAWISEQVGPLLLELKPDVVLVEYIRLAYLKPSEPNPRTTWWLDTIDVMHERHRRYLENHQTHWLAIGADEERDVLNSFDGVIAITRRDAESFRTMGVTVPLCVCGHAVEVSAGLEPLPGFPPLQIGFIGAGDDANAKGIQWFLAEVFPRLPASCVVHVAGSLCKTMTLPPISRLHVHGFVDDVATFYRGLHVMINPVAFGGGIKIKSVEALAHGKALVTTSVGAEGLENGAGTAFRVADLADDFADELIRLHDDPALLRELSRAAHAFAFDHFQADTVYADLRSHLGHV